jgi:hypothetical protein
MQITGDFVWYSTPKTFLTKLGSGELRAAAAMGLNEHAAEQRRQAVVGISSYTGVPRGRVGATTRLIKASGTGSEIQAVIRTSDKAIGLAEYGKPTWVRDLNPMADGKRGGSVSSMAGAEATGWNVRRIFKHSFIANGRVVVRVDKTSRRLKTLSMAVLANELAKPSRPNVAAAERYAAIDLERRVLRHVIRQLGT